MSLIFKARFLSCGHRFSLQSNIFKRGFFHSLRSTKITRVCQPVAQVRFYGSEENKFRSENRIRVYDGILHKKIRFVKIFSLGTSVATILVQPYLVSKALADGKSAVAISMILLTFGFFSFITPLLLHLITKRYVVHVDYNPVKDTYIATTYSIFVQKKELEFTPEDVHLPNMSEMLTSCVIKGFPVFMDVTMFSDIDHYKRIMGFDKPMDFSLNFEDIKSKKN